MRTGLGAILDAAVRAEPTLEVSVKEARLMLSLLGEGASAIRPSELTAQDALALKERLRAFVKMESEE